MKEYDIIIIGGGTAGISAAIAAKEQGMDNILLIEREEQLGGSINQYIHVGFGMYAFGENLTGPEYVQMLINRVNELSIESLLNTLVINITKDKSITAVNEEGIIEFKAKAIILAMGSREKPRGAINIPGSRCAGIFTVGTAQNFINIEGYMPGKQVVIVGSGDVGVLTARSMILEGANIKAIIELMPYAAASRRNIEQCIEEFNIPLKLGYTVVDIKGKDRVEAVVIAKVNEDNVPIIGTEEYIFCDTLLLTAGLLPEIDLPQKAEIGISEITTGVVVDKGMQTNIEGIFACGDIVYVHDLEEDITAESSSAGRNAVKYIIEKTRR